VIKEVRRESLRIVAEFQAREKELGIRGGTKSPDFGLSRAGQAWFEGCEFDDLLRYTDVPDGDLVRNFRLAIQLMRQVAKALETSLDLRDRVLSIMRQINRDEVDAERQLRLG
jgi:superfamily II RNA helicase